MALEAAWPPNHPTDEIEAEHADSEQTADQSSIESPNNCGPSAQLGEAVGGLGGGGSRCRRFASATRNRRLMLPARPVSPSRCAPISGRRGVDVVLVTAELMGDPKPGYVRAELRHDEGRSAPVGQDD